MRENEREGQREPARNGVGGKREKRGKIDRSSLLYFNKVLQKCVKKKRMEEGELRYRNEL